jgi:hypothetical protein
MEWTDNLYPTFRQLANASARLSAIPNTEVPDVIFWQPPWAQRILPAGQIL